MRRIAGESLDTLLYVDYVFGLIRKTDKVNLNGYAQRKPKKIVFYSVYVNCAEDYEEIMKCINESLEDFELILLINSGRLKISIPDNSKSVVVNKQNKGRDFGSLVLAIKSSTALLTEDVELLILNDSIFWKTGSLHSFIKNARQSSSDVTGMTMSHQHTRHLQSFALHFKGIKLSTREALGQIRVLRFKRSIVKYGEKKLSQDLVARGVKIGAIYDQNILKVSIGNYAPWYGEDFNDLKELIRSEVPLNPTIHFWPELAADAGFIKKSLLLNPARFKLLPRTNENLIKLLAQWKVNLVN